MPSTVIPKRRWTRRKTEANQNNKDNNNNNNNIYIIIRKNNKMKKNNSNKQNNNKKTKTTTWWIVRRTTIIRHNNKNKGNNSTCPVQWFQTILCSFAHPVSSELLKKYFQLPVRCDSANLSNAVPIQLHQHGPCQDTKVRSPPICNCGRIFWTKEPFASRLHTFDPCNFPHWKSSSAEVSWISSSERLYQVGNKDPPIYHVFALVSGFLPNNWKNQGVQTRMTDSSVPSPRHSNLAQRNRSIT